MNEQTAKSPASSLERVVSHAAELNPNHIGIKAWRRLTPRQRRFIMKHRSQARSLANFYKGGQGYEIKHG